jgi:hypothetical protein
MPVFRFRHLVMLKFPVVLLSGCALALATLPAHACGGRLHMEVGPSGVYQLGYAEAIAAQPALAGCPLPRLALSTHGTEVPLRVLDSDGDGRFGPGDSLEWIGLRLHGAQTWNDPHSRVNVYELGASDGTHARMQEHHAGTQGNAAEASLSRHLHLEDDSMMIRLKTEQVHAGEQPDLWYWAKLTMIDPAPFETHFDLPGLRAAHPPLSLRLGFRGWSSVLPHKGYAQPPDHRVVVTLNGRQVATLDWSGDSHVERDLTLPAGSLRARDNRLALQVPARLPPWSKDTPIVDVVMFDYLDVDYPLGRDDDGQAPFRIGVAGAPRTDATDAPLLFGSDGVLYVPDSRNGHAAYATAPAGTRMFPLDARHDALAPGGLRAIHDGIDLRHPAQGYDYIIVAHPTLLAATQPLAEFHRRHGHEVRLVDVDDVYDQFNHGIVDPRAIRDFLHYAYQHWPAPHPHDVLLVGDASFDLSDHQRDQRYYAKWTDRELLFPGQFGTIPGTPYAQDDVAPAARNLIPTFQYYGAEGQSASDNGFIDFGKDGKPALAIGRFPVIHPDEVKAIVDKTIAYVEHPRIGAWRQSAMFITDDNPGFQSASDKLAAEAGDFGFSAERIYPQSNDKDNHLHQQAIRQGLDDGQLLVHFLGHGGRYIWRTGPPDPSKNHDLFTLDDVAALKNAGRLPLVLSMTCYSAPFDNPTEDSIGERFLREPHNGAVAVFAASWRNAPDPSFSHDLLHDLLQPGVAIGDAILAAKRSARNRDMVEMYNLLGDPALMLQRPREQLRIAQVGDRWGQRVAIEVPGVERFHGTLRVEWLDAKQNLLESRDYRIDDPRLLLPPAPAKAHDVRVYALDPSRSTDALGGLTLQTPTVTQPWWRRWHWPVSPKPLPPAKDRIFGSNFGG